MSISQEANSLLEVQRLAGNRAVSAVVQRDLADLEYVNVPGGTQIKYRTGLHGDIITSDPAPVGISLLPIESKPWKKKHLHAHAHSMPSGF